MVNGDTHAIGFTRLTAGGAITLILPSVFGEASRRTPSNAPFATKLV